MKGKILLLTGVAIGYVLGSRAGRERYEEIKSAANKLWNDPRVQKPVHQAGEFVKDKAPEVAEFVADGAKKVVAQVSGSGSKSTTTARKPATRSTAAKSSTAK